MLNKYIKEKLNVVSLRFCVFAVVIILAGKQENMHAQTLDSLITKGLKNNSGLKALYAKKEAADRRADSYNFLPPPTVSLEFSQIPTSSGNIINEALSNNLSVSQMFMPGGKLDAMVNAEKKNTSVIEHEIHALKNTVAADIKMLYYQGWQAAEKLKVLKESLELYRMTRKALDADYQRTGSGTADKYLLDGIIAATEAQIYSAEKDFESILSAMRLKLQITETPMITYEKLPEPGNLKIDSLYALLGKNPELNKMDAMNEMKRAEIAANDKELIPDIMVQGMLMRMPKGMILTSASPMNMLTGMSKTEYMYSLMASVTLPFAPWSRGKIEAKHDELAAGIRQNEEEQKEMSYKMRAEITRYYKQYESATATAARYRSAVLPALTKAVESAGSQYAAGAVSLAQYIEYRRMLNMESMNYIMAVGDAWMAAAGIEMMTGKNK